MKYMIPLAAMLSLTACVVVDPLPLGAGGALGPVYGTAPAEAVGPGPYLTGNVGTRTTAAPAPAPAALPYPVPAGWRINPFNDDLPQYGFVGGREGVVVNTGISPAPREVYAVSPPTAPDCFNMIDIYGTTHLNVCQ